MGDLLVPKSLGNASAPRPHATGATAATASVSNLPPALASSGIGTVLRGVVAEQLGRGAVLLKTDHGSVTLHSNLALKLGSEVVLQLQSQGVQTRVLVLSIDQHSVAGATRGAALEGPVPGNSSSQPTTGERAVPGGAGQPARAGATQSTPAPANATPSSPNSPSATAGALSAGAAIRGAITTGLVLPATVVATPTAGTPLAGPAAAPSAPGNAPLAPQPGLIPEPGSTLTVRILAIAPAGAPSLVAEVLPHTGTSRQFSATLAAATEGAAGARAPAQTVLNTPIGQLQMAAPPPGQEGTRVLFEVLDAARSASEAGGRIVELRGAFHRLATGWPALADAHDALLAPGATAAEAPGELPIPRPGAQLASTMLFFLAALRAGSLRNWLGETAAGRLAGADGGRLGARLGNEFGQLARLANEPSPNGWQTHLIPLDTGERLEQIRLYYRRQGGQDGPMGEDDAQRFVVEAEISRFGLFQLDGLVRAKQFDLLVRSGKPLSAEIRTDIRGIFGETLSAGGFAGTIKFDGGTVRQFDPFATKGEVGGAVSGLVV